LDCCGGNGSGRCASPPELRLAGTRFGKSGRSRPRSGGHQAKGIPVVPSPPPSRNFPRPKQCIRTTTYHAFSLFKGHRGKTAVKVETDAATVEKDKPSPDLSASASTKDGMVVLSFVNPFPDQDLEIQCALRGANAKDATALLLHDADCNAYNSFDAPDRVMPRPHTVKLEGATVRLDLPRMSVATVTLAP